VTSTVSAPAALAAAPNQTLTFSGGSSQSIAACINVAQATGSNTTCENFAAEGNMS
jgi:hypothetical protein